MINHVYIFIALQDYPLRFFHLFKFYTNWTGLYFAINVYNQKKTLKKGLSCSTKPTVIGFKILS